jgi:diketogulonate reductase-like aldo/keto reductase
MMAITCEFSKNMMAALLLTSVAGTIPTHPLAGGGEMPLLGMGGDDFEGWFKAASSPGKPAMIQTFHGYGNGAHLAPQIQAFGRENVFVSTGIPCGCCGSDAPKVQPMNASLAMGYIMDELSQLNTTYVDLLLFHHRCKTPEETAAVWTAFEECKKTGKAKHIGVSNFNTHDLTTLLTTVKEPVEVLEAHFGVGLMDFEVIEFAKKNSIHPVAFSSTSEKNTDLDLSTVTKIATAHNISDIQVMYAYVHQNDITVLSSYDPHHPEWVTEDLDIFNIKLTTDEMGALDKVTLGKRTCPDCFTDECQACGQALVKLGCDIGALHGGYIWGRDNPKGIECLACAAKPENKAQVQKACGDTSRGESVETMVPKACQI